MQRSATLQPLSREHHSALTLAKACERAAQSGNGEIISQACLRANLAFSNELEPHFQIEEHSLLPMLRSADVQMLVQRTWADHQRLRELRNGLQQNDAEVLAEFGKRLSAHVRFEERELFPAIESVLEESIGKFQNSLSVSGKHPF